MGVILKLTLRYMRKNRRRTLATVLAIAVAMTAITMVMLFGDVFLERLGETVAEREGGYHAVFHELTPEQAEELEKRPEIKSCKQAEDCQEHSESGALCVQVTMKKVNLGMFRTTQKIAGAIGMPAVPLRDRPMLADGIRAKYQVTYHMELLVYCGIQADNWMGVGVLIRVTILMLVLVGSIMIYNSYAISVFEKLKYLGILGNAGASGRQKAFVVFWEGMLSGLVGIPAGIWAGTLLVRGILGRMRDSLMYGELAAHLTPGMAVKLILAGCLMIAIACYFPAKQAVTATGMELVSGQYSMTARVQKKTSLLKKGRLIPVTGMLGVKNIWIRRRGYVFNGLILAVSFCLLMDGIVAMRGMSGEYYLEDDRKRPKLNLWLEIHSEDTDKIRTFYERVDTLPEVTSISLERTLDLSGGLLDREELRDGQEELLPLSYVGTESNMEIMDLHSGKVVSGCWVDPYIIGLDENTFQAYVEKAGYEVPEGRQYPVLVEDYLVTGTENGSVRQSILKGEPGETFSFLYSRYGDMDKGQFGNMEMSDVRGLIGKLEEIIEAEFCLIGRTKEAPPYPYYSGTKEDPDGHQDVDMQILKIYLSMEDFDKLLKDPAYRDTYGPHNGKYELLNPREDKSILTYIKFDIEREIAEETEGEPSLKGLLSGSRELSREVWRDQEVEQKIRQIAKETGLAGEYDFGSHAVWQRDQYFHSEKMLLLVLGYGVILMIVALSLTNILQNISMGMRTRRREFAAYISMGMDVRSLRRMLLAENSVCGIAASLVGIPMSLLWLTEVYKELGYSRLICPLFPADLFLLQMIVAVILIAVPVVHTLMQMRYLNVIESIRNENV